MNFYGTPFRFAGDRLEDAPDLRVVRDVFRLLPNALPLWLNFLETDREGFHRRLRASRA